MLERAGAMPRRRNPTRLYRIVRDQQAGWDNFISDEAKGAVWRPEQQADPRLYRGISMFSSRERASERAVRWPRLGAWLAELVLPKAGYIEVHKTLSDPTHYTVIGLPRILAQLVRRVERAR